MLAPFLSEADPATTSEGSIDPLGLYAIADSLAMKLAPGVRERQSHPGYLTAIAVAASLCSRFDRDAIAKDGVSEPWQVFEWYMVEGLVRTTEDNDELVGLPGREKAARALENKLHLSADRYLKTPRVFGFHGVYRRLARNLDIIDRFGYPGETGYDLITNWEKEQRLEGFFSEEKGPGPGDYHSRQLYNAVKDSLEKGAVCRSEGWSGWSFFHRYLNPSRIGVKEGKIIFDALLNPEAELRRQVFLFLVSDEGIKIRQDSESERRFHEGLRSKADPILKELLDTIFLYEEFSRLLQDAFDDCRYLMTQKRGKVSPKEFSHLGGVIQASRQVPEIYGPLSDRLEAFGEAIRFENNFSLIAEKLPPKNWVSLLLEHHRRIQANKPPAGKAPWYERFDDGSAIIRPAYRRKKGGLHNDGYLHYYRTNPLWSFCRDLNKVPK